MPRDLPTPAFQVVSRILVRAPLLPARWLAAAGPALSRVPLGAAALALASADLTAALARKGTGARGPAAEALSRYARRAAFRPTPAGLLAGVAVAGLGARTRLATGEPRAVLAPTWARLAALGRALLDAPDVRLHVRLRAAPSLLRSGSEATWLALEADRLDPRTAEVDEGLGAVLEAAAAWAPWPAVRAALATATGAPDEELDDHLLVLVDDGLLCHDLEPPLVGPPPLAWLTARLAHLPAETEPVLASVRSGLAAAAAALAQTDVGEARARLAALPGAERAPGDVAGVLVHFPRRPLVLSSAAVGRAAELAPLLFALQEAMAAPAAERALDPALLGGLDAITETFGAGALEPAALVSGAYGQTLAGGDEHPPAPGCPPALLALLVEALAAAARDGRAEIVLAGRTLEPLLPPMEAPPSFELFLAPAREPPRSPPGTGWLLGLHAPAGASAGRFAAALGAPLAEGLAELAAHEPAARPGEEALDVVFAPSRALADLCAHPPVRGRALALSGWPAGAAVVPAALALVADGAAAEPLALREAAGQPVAPSPLHRVRSTTAPPGLHRLLAGWSFARQHAPWAFSWGPLAGLASLPRVVLDGFVVAPASWRIPDRAALAARGAVARWRREGGVPAVVQVGQGDELLPVDLAAPSAATELERFAGGRAFEIWPPLARLLDEDGRRVEAVVMVVSAPAPEQAEGRRAAIAATRAAGEVPPPAAAGPAPGWTTYRLHGAEDRQDAVLFAAVAPAIAGARAAGEIDGWFFLPYAGPGGAGPHLRVRAHAASDRQAQAFARRLREALAPLRAAGDVVTVETAEYFRESARYGGAALMPAVERLFEAGSDLALAVLEAEAAAAEPLDGDRRLLAARAADALARALGLELAARHQLARRRRAAFARAEGDEPAELRAEIRRLHRALAAHLEGSAEDAFTPALAAFARAAADAADSLSRAARADVVATLPALLHVQTVRLAGPHAGEEQGAWALWERALESIVKRARA
jgi:thiopeptide-type bacteriocin biosynthesis protein